MNTASSEQHPALDPEVERRLPYLVEATRQLGRAELTKIVPLAEQLDPEYRVQLTVATRIRALLQDNRNAYLPMSQVHPAMQTLIDRGKLVASPIAADLADRSQGYGKGYEDGNIYSVAADHPSQYAA